MGQYILLLEHLKIIVFLQLKVTYMWNIVLPHTIHGFFQVVQVLVAPPTQMVSQHPVRGHHGIAYSLGKTRRTNKRRPAQSNLV